MVRPAKPYELGYVCETKLEALRRALIEGKQSGTSDYSLQGILDELKSEN